MILASASPRRIEIFRAHGEDPLILPANIQEHLPTFLSPAEATMFLALSKGLHVRAGIDDRTGKEHDHIVAADTLVVDRDRILGKPAGPEDAYETLMSLSGRTHQVITGVSLLSTKKRAGSAAPILCFFDCSHVTFSQLPADDLDRYVQTDEPYDKAGGYAIQGTFSRYVSEIKGDRDNVIGFPWRAYRSALSRFLSAD